MEFTKPFEKLNKNNASIAGGKGASLGEMMQAGIPVPPGFVVLSTTFDYFLHETDLTQEIQAILEKVDHKAIHTIDEASEKIRGLIESQEFPDDIAQEVLNEFKKLDTEFVAVRSSATAEDGADHAWAGQLESYLNTTGETLLTHVKKCWASLFTPRAIFYRFEKGLFGTEISVAVVVQKMIQSEISGIAFSVHPITEDYNQLIIEAGFGLGEAIVSGQITPDSYVVEKEPLKIIDTTPNTQTRGLFRDPNGGNEWKEISEPQASSQVLNESQILELAELIIHIEKHYGFPCDIEWAFEGRKFYIVQSRPITTLSNQEKSVKKITLSKIFSREKTLFYFSMWNDSDRLGWKNFLAHEVRNNLFLIPPPGQKGSVWYASEELSEIDNLLKKTLQEKPELIGEFKTVLDTNWEVIFPYLSDAKKIGSIEEFDFYYKHLVEWWSAMNTTFSIPDMKEVSEDVRKLFLSYRTESEKYTEKMNKVLVAFWHEYFPELKELTFCVAPSEVHRIVSGDKNLLEEIEKRKNGCFMLNAVIYPLSGLDKKLEETGLSLEKSATKSEEEIKGNSAYKGKVSGKVKKILSFKDMPNFKAGEILVTEMTNPDYLPIMKMAGAVITDEGGATCHAAIACRELKIPCIVGTKVATQILEDGMEVEVDADNGTVRIILSQEEHEKEDGLYQFSSLALKDFKPEEWHFFGLWKQDLFSSCFWTTCFELETFSKLGLHISDLGILLLNGGNFFYNKPIFEQIDVQISKILAEEDNDFFKHFEEEAKDTYLKGIEFIKTIQLKDNISPEQFTKFLSHARNMSLYWCFAAVQLATILERIFRDQIVKDKVPSNAIAAIVPTIQTPLLDQQQELRSLKKEIDGRKLAEIKEDKKLLEKLEVHRQKYEWIEIANWIGNELTLERLIEQINHAEEKTETVTNKVEMSPELARTAESLGYVGYVKQAGSEYVAMLALQARPFLTQVARQIGVDYLEMMSLTHNEVLKGLKSEITFSELKQLVNNRKETNWIVIAEDHNQTIFVENKDDITYLEQKMIPTADKEVEELQGTVGNPGKAKGKVCVVMNVNDFAKMQTGNVLVTTMTTPDFVIMMQKASAIVTDIGGMLSHAAIVSREINKPCVIGTIIATKVLKDGMEVEVDADNGVVKILNHGK